MRAIARHLRVWQEHGEAGVGGAGSAAVCAVSAGVCGGRVRASDPRVVGGVPVPADVGVRGTGEVDPREDGVLRGVAALRPLFVLPDPASRIDYEAGQLAQRDLWFPPVDIPVG